MIERPTTRLATRALIAALTLVGAALRLWNLAGQSLWLDEVFTARIAPLSFAGIVSAIRMDLDTPPLHPFTVHAFLGLGNNDFMLRFPSAAASILAIPLMYSVARRLRGERTAILATALMAFSPFAVYYAQEARMYSQVLMLAILAFYCLLRALDVARPEPGADRDDGQGGTPSAARRRWWVGFVLAGAAGLYTHFFGFFVIGLLALYAGGVLFLRRGARVRGDALALAAALVGIGVLYLPWAPVLLGFLRENYAASPYGQNWQANLSGRVALNMLTVMLGGYWANLLARWLSRGLLALGLAALARGRPLLALLLGLSVVAPFATVITLNPGHFVTERYFIIMLPMLILGMAEGLGVLALAGSALLSAGPGRRAGRWRDLLAGAPALAALLVVIVLSASGLERYFAEPPKPAWRALAHYAASTIPAGDLIVVATFPHWDKEPLQHYLRTGGRRVVYAAEEPDMRRLLKAERSHPWWIVYAGTSRNLGRLMRQGVGEHFSVTPFDYLAVLHRTGEPVDGLDDGRIILGALKPRIPGPYQGEVQRVMDGLASASGDMGVPIPPPLPTTVK